MTTEESAQDRIAFLRSLRAVRQFRPDPIPEQVVDDLLEVARWSGSSMNQQRGNSSSSGTARLWRSSARSKGMSSILPAQRWGSSWSWQVIRSGMPTKPLTRAA